MTGRDECRIESPRALLAGKRRSGGPLSRRAVLLTGLLLGIITARGAFAQEASPNSQRVRPVQTRPEGVERVRRRIEEIRRTTDRWRRREAPLPPSESFPSLSSRRKAARPQRRRPRMDLARFERRLRRSLESLLAVDNARLYRGKEVVYVPLRAPSPQPTRSSLSRSVQPDTALVEGTTRIADTIRASLDTIRTVTDTALIASDPAAGRNAIGERRIQMVETRLLDEGVFRAFEVNFAFGMATLKPRATRTLDAVGAVLERYPELRIEIGGHTDAVGTGAFNQRLSEARAKAVRTYLLEGFEIAPGRLSVRGYGEGQPVAPNDSPAGRALNRRVAFLVLNRGAVAFPNR